MTQYNYQSTPGRRKTSSGNRRGSGKNRFLTVLLYYVLPFIVVNSIIFFLVTSKPKADITIGESSDYISTTMELKINSFLPLSSVQVALDGTQIEMTKTGSRTYTAVLQNNGMLEVQLTAFNKMKTIIYDQVSVLDDTPPVIKDQVFDDGILSFRLEDSQSGVDYSSITASTDDDSDLLPLSIDRSTGLVTFEIQKENLTITAKDEIGNEMHVTFNSDGESVEEAELESEEATDTQTDDEAETETSAEQ